MATDLSRVRRLLGEKLTEEMLKRLMVYGMRKAHRLCWQGMLGGAMPGGSEAKGIQSADLLKSVPPTASWSSLRRALSKGGLSALRSRHQSGFEACNKSRRRRWHGLA